MKKTMSALRGRIVQEYGSQSEFAKFIGTSQQTIVAKLSGRVPFSQKDIIEWSKALNITPEEVTPIFFENKL